MFTFHLWRIGTRIKYRIIIQIHDEITDLFMDRMKRSTNIVWMTVPRVTVISFWSSITEICWNTKKINTLGRFSQLKIYPLPYKWINSRINLVIYKITTKEKLFESFSKKLIDFKVILQRKVQINFPERSFDSNLTLEKSIDPKLTL